MKKPSTSTSNQPAIPSWAFAPIVSPSFAQTLRFPENLPVLSSRDVGLYHGQYIALLAYAHEELSKLVVELLKLESVISKQRNLIILMSGTTTKWQLESTIESNLKIVELRDQELLVRMKKETLQTYAANFERYAAALSRELTRRGSEQRAAGV